LGGVHLKLDRAIAFMNRLAIRDKGGNIVPFVLNHSQHTTLDALKKKEVANEPLWCLILKARRVGISTLAEGLLTAHCFAEDNAQAMILAHKFKSAKALFGVAKRMRDSVRAWMPPGTQQLLKYPHTGSQLEVQTAGSTTSGRGLSLSAIHFSEAAYYPGNAESFTSLLPAVPQKPGTIVIVESTANGKSGDGQTFFDLWVAAIEGRNAFVPIFIPWTMDPDCIRDEEEAEDAPGDEEEEKLMASGVTRAQLAWRRMTIETECQGLVEKFHQEFPTTWEEAFISSGNPAFNEAERAYAAKFINPPFSIKPKATMMVVRDEKTPKHWTYTADRNGIVMWEKPIVGHKYYLGADVARAKTNQSDYSAITIWNGTTGDQAARYAERVDPFKLADLIDMLARDYNNAMVTIELTGGFGSWTQKQVRDVYHYSNLYRWKGSKDDSMPGKTIKQALGWESTYASRKLMFSAMREMLRYQKIQVYDPQLLAQIEAATYDEDWRWELEIGHDDILVSAMLAVISIQQYPPPRRLLSRVLDPERKAAEKDQTDRAFEPIFQLDPRWTLKRHWARVRKGPKHDRLAGI
jgi:hypothetical protein